MNTSLSTWNSSTVANSYRESYAIHVKKSELIAVSISLGVYRSTAACQKIIRLVIETKVEMTIRPIKDAGFL